MKHYFNLLFCLFCLLVSNGALAEIIEQIVPYQHEGESFQGFLYYDNSIKDKRPGVLVVHEWWGLNSYVKKRARMLAELGYTAFAVDMYGKGKVTDKADQAREWMQEVTADVEDWRARAQLGIKLLTDSPYVDADKIAAIGYCFGGATILQLAYSGSDINGVVSFHGALPTPDDDDLKNIKTSILILHGNADSFVPRELIEKLQSKLDAAGADWQMVFYGNARHSFTNEDAGRYGIENLKYDANADRRSWDHMQRFFDEIFADKAN